MNQHPTTSMLRRGAILMALMSLWSQTSAFTSLAPARTSRSQLSLPEPKSMPSFQSRSHGKLHLFNDDNTNDEWREMAEVVGKTAKTVGEKAVELIGKGGSQLKKLAVKGAKSLKAALFPPDGEETATFQRSPVVDTQDEDLFRSIFQNDDVLPDPLAAATILDRVVEEAALILEDDQVAASVLGSSIQHSVPISQSSQTRTVAGKTITNVQASFEVWGLRGRGVALVSALDGDISSLSLQVSGQVYPIRPTSTASSYIPKTSRTEAPRPWEPEEVEAVLEVEVMEGVRRLNPPKGGRVIDAEILDKRTIL